MCGIAGFIGFGDSARRLGRHDLQVMARALSHRGPDDEEFYLDQFTDDIIVGLGHRRLSIIDLSAAGRQPMSNEDGTIRLVFNGEVYNYRTLRQTLVERGHHFTSETDSEVVLHAYEVWGTKSFGLLNGMFAFALWDERRGKLLLVRDRLGIKPLFYYLNDSAVAFSSELKGLYTLPFFNKTIDPVGFAQFLRYHSPLAPNTIFRDTYHLMPGTFASFDVSGRHSFETYWDVFRVPLASSKDSGTAAAPPPFVEFEALFKDLMAEHLQSDVPVGVLLSGGIDSSTVAAIAGEVAHDGGRVKTFTASSGNPAIDEAPYARRVAQHLNTDHYEFSITDEEAVGALPAIVEMCDQPFSDSSIFPTYLIAKHAREQVKVLLSGDGGDELFWGYNGFHRLARLRPLFALPQLLRSSLFKAADVWPRSLDVTGGRAKRLAQCTSMADAYQLVCGNLKPDDILDLTTTTPAQIRESLVPFSTHDDLFSAGADPLELIQRLHIAHILPNDSLTKVDRASMSVGLEVRVPFLDHRLVEFALALPFVLKYNRGTTKVLLRQLAYSRIPRQLLDRPKKGFAAPVSDWLANGLRDQMLDHLSPSRLRQTGLWKQSAVTRLVTEFLAGDTRQARRIWPVFVFELWRDRYWE